MSGWKRPDIVVGGCVGDGDCNWMTWWAYGMELPGFSQLIEQV
jgi:hypothetical protein